MAGPASSVPHALDLLRGAQPPDAAILDVELRATDVFPLADILLGLDIPFVFVTAYETHELPDGFSRVPHFVKPLMDQACIDAVLDLAGQRPAA